MNGRGKEPINLSTQSTIMSMSFTVNKKPPCCSMHVVWGSSAHTDCLYVSYTARDEEHHQICVCLCL